jgi:hypothetical protein
MGLFKKKDGSPTKFGKLFGGGKDAARGAQNIIGQAQGLVESIGNIRPGVNVDGSVQHKLPSGIYILGAGALLVWLLTKKKK